jgi:hypothetical protein
MSAVPDSMRLAVSSRERVLGGVRIVQALGILGATG